MKTYLQWLKELNNGWLDLEFAGLGGIGGAVIPDILRTALYSDIDSSPVIKKTKLRVGLFDGDHYELRNIKRQDFRELGNKAEVLSESLQAKFPQTFFRFHPYFIGLTKSEKTLDIGSQVKEGQVWFLSPDNNKTRKIFNDHFQKLQDGVLIAGGNNELDGMAHLYIRKEGADVTPPLIFQYPALENPDDLLPDELGCDRSEDTQLFVTNKDIAMAMLILFHQLLITPAENSPSFFRIFCGVNSGKRRVE